MGTRQRRDRERAELREAILTAARDIVGSGGRWEDLTIRKIADAIEYSPAALYAHFASRDEIVRALCIDGYRQLLESMIPLASEPDPERRLIALGRGYIAFGLANPATYRIIFMEDPRITQALADAQNASEDTGSQALGILSATIAELIEAGRLSRAVNPLVAADVLWASLHGLVSLKITCEAFPQTETEALGEAMLETLLSGLARLGEPPPQNAKQKSVVPAGAPRRRTA